MTDLLIVASPTSAPLSTDVPVPTDGQPQHRRCAGCGARWRPHDRLYCCGRDWSDGPFPFTVAVWRMYQEPDHKGHETDRISGTPWLQCLDCSTEDEVVDWTVIEPVGAIVELVEVVGPSHHADEMSARPCCIAYPEAGWHTPTGQVTVLDRPIPYERPSECRECESPIGRSWCGNCGPGAAMRPASVWAADDDLTAKLTKVLS